MSLYNMLFGQRQHSGVVMAVLGNPDVGRFRDAWVERDGNGTVRLAVHTRNGGGNREHWQSYNTIEGDSCSCPGCVIQYQLPKHPLYISDADDDFDCTYATIYFRVPDEFIADFEAIADDKPFDPGERWQALFDAMGKSQP